MKGKGKKEKNGTCTIRMAKSDSMLVIFWILQSGNIHLWKRVGKMA